MRTCGAKFPRGTNARKGKKLLTENFKGATGTAPATPYNKSNTATVDIIEAFFTASECLSENRGRRIPAYYEDTLQAEGSPTQEVTLLQPLAN
jgi:hypothetical protein